MSRRGHGSGVTCLGNLFVHQLQRRLGRYLNYFCYHLLSGEKNLGEESPSTVSLLIRNLSRNGNHLSKVIIKYDDLRLLKKKASRGVVVVKMLRVKLFEKLPVFTSIFGCR